MRYGALPSNLLESLAFAAGKVPEPAIDALISLMKTRSIMAGVKLGVFEAFAEGARLPAEVAAERQLDPEACELLLRALVFCGYLEQQGDRFALSRLGRESMLPGSPHDFRGYLLWNYEQWKFVQHLGDLVRHGRALDFHHTMEDPEAWANYERAMSEFAREDAPRVAREVPLRHGARKVLDLAGGHGAFGAALCRRRPGMRSVVLDLPAALESGRALARELGIDDVVEHRAGNILEEDFEPAQDVVLLSQILHHFKPEQIRLILRKAWQALESEGTIVIWEIEAPDTKKQKANLGDGAALYFRLTSNARAYHSKDYAAWLVEADFEKIRIRRPLLSPGGLLLTARKPAEKPEGKP